MPVLVILCYSAVITEVAVSRQMFADILILIARLRELFAPV
jgi:hypothetical protein